MAPIVELRGITKRFPGVLANDNVSLDVEADEILGLLGENGAGKSVLMSVLYGHHQPESGEILIAGQPVVFDSPLDAIEHGIGMVHQHFMLVPPLSVLDNIILGAEPTRSFGRIDRAAARTGVADLSERYGLNVDLDARVEDIPVGMAQRVEILKAVYRKARILIMDEPTAVLAPQEVDGLYDILQSLRAEGVPTIFITHKLREILMFCNRVVVMRGGRVVDELTTADATARSLASAMVGRDVLLRVDKPPADPGEPVLEVTGLSTKSAGGDLALDAVSLTVRAGEIVGVAGVAGNGQSDLVNALCGTLPARSGEVRLAGRDVSRAGRKARLEAGMSVVPEDRLRDGVILTFPVAENAVLGDHDAPEFGTALMRNRRAVREHARALIARFDVRCRDEQVPMSSLSGGNQQKLVCGREFGRSPALLIAAQPTRGVDVGAIEFIHRQLVELRDAGTGVLLVSTELDEILALSDRIVVMFQGAIVAELDAATATTEEIGLYMAGGHIAPCDLMADRPTRDRGIVAVATASIRESG